MLSQFYCWQLVQFVWRSCCIMVKRFYSRIKMLLSDFLRRKHRFLKALLSESYFFARISCSLNPCEQFRYSKCPSSIGYTVLFLLPFLANESGFLFWMIKGTYRVSPFWTWILTGSESPGEEWCHHKDADAQKGLNKDLLSSENGNFSLN